MEQQPDRVEQEPDRAERDPRDESSLSGWQLFWIAELVALLIALISPITPTKTGGRVRLGPYFFEQSGYLHEVFLHFLLVNLVYAIIFAAGFLYVRWDRRRKAV